MKAISGIVCLMPDIVHYLPEGETDAERKKKLSPGTKKTPIPEFFPFTHLGPPNF